jgi:hypothetical protein
MHYRLFSKIMLPCNSTQIIPFFNSKIICWEQPGNKVAGLNIIETRIFSEILPRSVIVSKGGVEFVSE